jgi:catechol 2,3-dioxygenase-like lactoylglutathione lyase family enzyme
MFTSDVMRSVAFYRDVLGLRPVRPLADIIAFMHGAHGSDHHMLAFAKSDGPGLHHSSWTCRRSTPWASAWSRWRGGYTEGWGVGRHVIGSNYFRYIRDPWGSFAEYSADIDYIPPDVEWPAADHPPEDSFYVWDRRCRTTSSRITSPRCARPRKPQNHKTRGKHDIVRRAIVGAIVVAGHRAAQHSRSSRRVRPSRSAARLR